MPDIRFSVARQGAAGKYYRDSRRQRFAAGAALPLTPPSRSTTELSGQVPSPMRRLITDDNSVSIKAFAVNNLASSQSMELTQ
jgi:hypothetical protein